MTHHDTLETRDPLVREAALMQALPLHIAHAKRHSTAIADWLQGVDAAAVNSRQALAQLPVLRKHELLERQRSLRGQDAFGGFATIGWAGLLRTSGARRVYQSPGPIYEPEGTSPDYWRAARALTAAGFEAGDLVHNCFSYHLTPGAWIMESGAHAIGCTVIPGGVGQTEQQLAVLADLRPCAYVGTPSFLKILIDKAAEAGQKLSFTKALVSGEACPPSLRDWFASQGIDVYQCYATADVGLIAYETASRQGLVVDEGVLLEIVRPGTGQPVAPGEVGEVVVTVLNPDYPLIRLATGDLSAVLPGTCPTGRTNARVRGWLGRADQTTKVRGMFVQPAQVAQVAQRVPQAGKLRLTVSGEMANDQLLLQAETDHASAEVQAQLAQAVRDVTKLRADVQCVPVGSLPNDGKVIDDVRSYA